MTRFGSLPREFRWWLADWWPLLLVGVVLVVIAFGLVGQYRWENRCHAQGGLVIESGMRVTCMDLRGTDIRRLEVK